MGKCGRIRTQSCKILKNRVLTVSFMIRSPNKAQYVLSDVIDYNSVSYICFCKINILGPKSQNS